MNTTALTILRTVATAALTTLTALGFYYPTWDHWIAAATLGAAILGIHVVPAIGQTVTPPRIPIPVNYPAMWQYTSAHNPTEPSSPVPHSAEPFTGE